MLSVRNATNTMISIIGSLYSCPATTPYVNHVLLKALTPRTRSSLVLSAKKNFTYLINHLLLTNLFSPIFKIHKIKNLKLNSFVQSTKMKK